MYVKYCIQLLKGRTPKCNPCAPQIWISSCYGLNVCVLPKFLCGNHNPHGDDIRRQGVWEVIKSSRWSHHDWNHSFHKRSPIDISCTFHLGKTYARRQKSVNQQVSPLSVHWSRTSQPSGLWEIIVLLTSHLVSGILF